jgi:hypothetical protein
VVIERTVDKVPGDLAPVIDAGDARVGASWCVESSECAVLVQESVAPKGIGKAADDLPFVVDPVGCRVA